MTVTGFVRDHVRTLGEEDMQQNMKLIFGGTLALVGTLGASIGLTQAIPKRSWLAGDSHIHSKYSPTYDQTKNPPEPQVAGEGAGGDAIYPTAQNAAKAREFGLSWMVTTDHGGPNHSKLNLTRAYPDLQASRTQVPELLQFYGMELNMPAMDHHTLIIPNTEEEWKNLFNIESQFDKAEAWPPDPTRDSGAFGIKALLYMNAMKKLPLIFANHPARSATGVGQYGLDEPYEFRNNNDVAPDVYHGMEGAPGHQAGGLDKDGKQKLKDGNPDGDRGAYGNDKARTFGGFDQMTAIVGGLWDSLLGEGRRFWIVATSDSHVNYADTTKPGIDFWPGQYQKTYVKAIKSYDDILDGLRSGRAFGTSGDLISELDLIAEAASSSAEMGGTLAVQGAQDVKVTIRFRDPESKNFNGDNPKVGRVDLIVGDVKGPAANRNLDKNETAKIVARFTEKEWKKDGEVYTIQTTIKADRDLYFRVRGTNVENQAVLEPEMDTKGEMPWKDIWFYSNPVFVEVKK
jgi:hypothetical protein